MGTYLGPDAKSHDFNDFLSFPAGFKKDFSRSATLPRNVQILSGSPLTPESFFEHCLGFDLSLLSQFRSTASLSSFFSCLSLASFFLFVLLPSCFVSFLLPFFVLVSMFSFVFLFH